MTEASAARLKQVAHLDPLGLEILLVMRIRGAANRDLLDHLNAVAFEADDFLWVVGEKTEFAHAKVEQDLRAESIIAQVAPEAELRVGLDGIQAFLLQLISVDLCG